MEKLERKKANCIRIFLSQFIKAILLNEETLKHFQTKCARKQLCNDDWIKDTEFLSNSNNERIGAVRVYTQALIHSNLFDACVDYRLTLIWLKENTKAICVLH